MVDAACYLNTWEVEVGGLGVHGQPWLYSEFKASLSNLSSEPCLEERAKGRKERSFKKKSSKRLVNTSVVATLLWFQWPMSREKECACL